MEVWNIFLWVLVAVMALIIGYSSLKNRLELVNTTSQEKLPKTKAEAFLSNPYIVPLETEKSDNSIPELASVLDTSEENEKENHKKPKKVKKKSKPQTIKIECPECSKKMEVPKLAGPQTVTCDNCGLSGEFEL